MNALLDIARNWLAPLQQMPLLLLALCAAPLAAIAYFRKAYPTRALVLIAAAPCVITATLLLRADALPLVVTVDVVIVLLAAVDLATLPRRATFHMRRDCARVLSIRKNHPVTLTVTNNGRRSFELSVRDGVPRQIEALPDEFSERLQPRSRVTFRYEVKAKQRGAFEIDAVYLRCRSLLGLWRLVVRYPLRTVVHVYPDMKQLSEYAVLARTNRLSLLGVRRTRRIGQDNEFERLRDFSLDDNYKHIDWRATARRNKLTVKDFQTNQSQRLMFLVDCGRMMTNRAAELSLLDHSLNAMLMLSYVALRQGDSVGLICFSSHVHTYVPCRGGMNQMNRLLHASFDRFAQLVESRYDQAFVTLSQRCRKRSLVILMSNVIDEVNAHQLQQYMGSLVGRHLPIGLLLRDRRLFDAADKPPRDEEQLYRAAAAAEILSWRHQVLTDLEHQGVMALDVFPEDMTAPLVNRYLEIKARHLL